MNQIKINRIRTAIAGGTYESETKLAIASDNVWESLRSMPDDDGEAAMRDVHGEGLGECDSNGEA